MAKKVIVYGAADCPACVELKELLDKESIRYGYVDIMASLGHLKKFINLRDNHPTLYKEAAAQGALGIPTVVVNDSDIYLPREEGEAWDLSIFCDEGK